MNYTYVTVLTNCSYSGGVKALDKSLKRVKSQYALKVLVPPDIDTGIVSDLEKEGISVLIADDFNVDLLSMDNKTSHWQETFFKLKVFDLTEYDKLIFLDADMIILNNIDHLFDKPHMSCVAAGNVLHSEWVDLNSGMMVIQPNHDEYLDLIRMIEPIYKQKTEEGIGVGDQDVIETYFADWRDNQELHLPETYNVMLGYAGHLKNKGYIQSAEDIYVYHFTGKQKPWRNNLFENLLILMKIFKRSRSSLDFQAYLYYRNILKQ